MKTRATASDGCNGENAATQTTVAIVAAVAEKERKRDEESVQIPYDLFVGAGGCITCGYDDEYEDEIRQGLEQKLDALVRHELYAKYKTAPSAEEREPADRHTGPAQRIPGFSLVTGIYSCTNLADEISTEVNRWTVPLLAL